MDVRIGDGLLIVKVIAGVDVPPPGAGFVTVTPFVPAVSRSAARMDALSVVEFTNVVALAVPPKFTTELFTKPVPVTVRVNPGSPTVAVVALSEVTVGSGLLTVKVSAGVDVPPPGAGLDTVTVSAPAVAMSAALIAAVICVALTNVVTFALPLKFTTEVFTKFVPFTVSVNAAPPAVAVVGLMVVVVGRSVGVDATVMVIPADVELA